MVVFKLPGYIKETYFFKSCILAPLKFFKRLYGQKQRELKHILASFLERLNSNEPNERKVIESLTDFCNYYDFTKGFIYQTDGFRYFLLKRNDWK